MEERSISMPVEAPQAARDVAGGPGSLGDPRTLQILTTEHWSLLSARSLVYNEAFSRAGMFLSFLSATLVALGLIATAVGFSDGFLMIAAVLLAIDVFIGAASLARIASASSDDIRFLQAMNRIRHAYVEMSPAVAPYLMGGHHDDPTTVLSMYGPVEATPATSFVHGLTTTPGMVGVITAAVGAALAAVLAMLATHHPLIAAVAGVGTFALLFILIVAISMRTIGTFWAGMHTMFPKDGSDQSRPDGR
jgi:hypothetical protein